MVVHGEYHWCLFSHRWSVVMVIHGVYQWCLAQLLAARKSEVTIACRVELRDEVWLPLFNVMVLLLGAWVLGIGFRGVSVYVLLLGTTCLSSPHHGLKARQ